MNKDIIKKYSSNIGKNDILEFGKKEGVSINENELNTLYNIIKNNADDILGDDFYNYIKKYKDRFNPSLYSKILEKYEKYKGFIN